MKNNVLVVGLTPEYYSSSVSRAVSDYQAAMRSTNMGASFITRSIVSIFDATYVDITSDFDLPQLQNSFDVCVVSLASHLGPSRDVSILVDFLKKLDIKTVFLSGGLDAGQMGTDPVHQSVRELIEYCSSENQWVGVRGAASALYLLRQGMENVVPIGCPTMYSNFPGMIKAPSVETKNDISIPFHWSIALSLLDELGDHRLIGQDCIDEELFLNNDYYRISKNISGRLGISQQEVKQKLADAISKNAHFPETYEKWYRTIGSQNALLSARLHAAICGLTQGVPTVLTTWDLRTQEIIDYFKIPSVANETLRKHGSVFALQHADFETFNSQQEVSWARWSEFLRQNNLNVEITEKFEVTDPVFNWEKALKNDNELLKTASYLQSQEQSSYLRSPRSFVRFAKRNIKNIRRNLG